MQKWKALSRTGKALILLAAIGLVFSLIGGLSVIGSAREVSQLKESIIRMESEMQSKLDRISAELLPDNTHQYVLRAYEGKIGVFNYDESVLYEIIDVDIRILPASDRAQLEAGITISGEVALRAITEDYTG